MDRDLLEKLPLIAGIAFAILVPSGIYIAVKVGRRREVERQAALALVATELGMGYAPMDYGILPHFGGYAFHRHGRVPYVSNIMYGRIQGASGVVFDYYCQLGTDRSPDPVYKTVAAFDFTAAPLPVFEVEGGHDGAFMRVIDTVLPEKGIDFSDDADFARAFHVTGTDVEAVRRVLGPEARAVLLQRKTWQFRSNGRHLLMSWMRSRPTPAQYPAFVADAFEAMQAMTGPRS